MFLQDFMTWQPNFFFYMKEILKKRILYLGHFKVTQISHSVFTCVHSYWRYFNSPCLSTFYVIYFLYFWQPVSYFLSALTNANYFISLPDVLLISSISPSFRIDERYMIFFKFKLVLGAIVLKLHKKQETFFIICIHSF